MRGMGPGRDDRHPVHREPAGISPAAEPVVLDYLAADTTERELHRALKDAHHRLEYERKWGDDDGEFKAEARARRAAIALRRAELATDEVAQQVELLTGLPAEDAVELLLRQTEQNRRLRPGDRIPRLSPGKTRYGVDENE